MRLRANVGFGRLRLCDHNGCGVWLLTQADNTRCRLHRSFSGKCCGDRACQYGSRRVI